METKNLLKDWPKFMSYLDEQGYCQAIKDAFRVEIARILKKMGTGYFSTYSDYLLEFRNVKPRSEAAIRRKRHIVEMIKRFDLFGYYPNKMVRFDKDRDRIYEVLIPQYKEIIDSYRNIQISLGLQKSTIYGNILTACHFLKHLQNAGIYSLEKVDENTVHELFYKDGRNIRGYEFSFSIRRFLNKTKTLLGEDICQRICSYLPVSAKIHKPYDAITTDELDKLKTVLLNDDLSFTLRDRAIMIVAIYTGLRRSDIANLCMDNIDWENDKLIIKQGKTGNPVTLPLRPVVGNAIYDYILNERPQIDSPYIFLHSRKGTKLNPTFFAKMSYKFFDAAGIRMNGENRGMHMFRHNVATSLINKGHDTPIVMSVLGHTVPLAVDYYLESDYAQLKECGIDISRWPIRKEVIL